MQWSRVKEGVRPSECPSPPSVTEDSFTDLVTVRDDLPSVVVGEVLLKRLLRTGVVTDKNLERCELVEVERAVVAVRRAKPRPDMLMFERYDGCGDTAYVGDRTGKKTSLVSAKLDRRQMPLEARARRPSVRHRYLPEGH